MSYAQLREVLLPAEPAGLELGVIELADGTGSFAMILRHEHTRTDELTDISALGLLARLPATQQEEASTVSAAPGDADHGATPNRCPRATSRPCPTWPSAPSAAASSGPTTSSSPSGRT